MMLQFYIMKETYNLKYSMQEECSISNIFRMLATKIKCWTSNSLRICWTAMMSQLYFLLSQFALIDDQYLQTSEIKKTLQ